MTSARATIVATYSRRMRLRFDDGSEVGARIKGKRLKPVCGDRVTAKTIVGETDWLITGIHERKNALTRPNTLGEIEVLAANIEHLTVIVAARPAPDWFLVDRYLCAAETISVPATIVFNKIDIKVPEGDIEETLADYRRIGYTVVTSSAKTGAGIKKLTAALIGNIGIIVGQSGVGKSSLINRIAPGAEQSTAELSGKLGTGRHTTVNSVMLALSGGGAIIDSPGVRDYAPALEDLQAVTHGYREIAAVAGGCRFNDCRHRHEPDCGVKSAVSAGCVSQRRYASYLRLLELTEGRNQFG